MLPACSGAETAGGDETATQEEATLTLAGSLNDMPDMASLNGAIAEAQFGTIFDGPGSYTLLAPNDAAFEELGEEGQTLLTEEQRPVLIGLLREHILPGHLTPENIAQALDSQDGEVTMTTLGGGAVTFAKEGETITVTNNSGSSARLVSNATAATNGVIIPLDTVLVPDEPPEA